MLRHERTANRRAKNARVIHIGHRYVGYAATVELATAIKAHIKDRLHGFVERQQGRAEVETLSAHGISTEAGTRADRL